MNPVLIWFWIIILAVATNGLIDDAKVRDARLSQIEFRLDRIDEQLRSR